MKTILRPGLVLFVLLSALTGLLYPFAVTGAAKAVFPAQAAGSLVERDGKPVGSSLIGQSFSDPKHFWGRPSATAPMAYNASASGGACVWRSISASTAAGGSRRRRAMRPAW